MAIAIVLAVTIVAVVCTVTVAAVVADITVVGVVANLAVVTMPRYVCCSRCNRPDQCDNGSCCDRCTVVVGLANVTNLPL